MRHGDVLKIAILADFCDTRWMVNAVMIPTPRGEAYLMPVARVMALYRRHSGEDAVRVVSTPPSLDVTASRTGDRVFVHVVNTDRTQACRAALQVRGVERFTGRAYEIAVADPMLEIDLHTADRLAPVERAGVGEGPWTFPAASVTALELEIAG